MIIIRTFIWIFIGMFIYTIGAIIFGLSIEYDVKFVWICDSHFSPYYELKEPSTKVRKFFVLLGEVLMDIGISIAIVAIIFVFIQFIVYAYDGIVELIHNSNIQYVAKK